MSMFYYYNPRIWLVACTSHSANPPEPRTFSELILREEKCLVRIPGAAQLPTILPVLKHPPSNRHLIYSLRAERTPLFGVCACAHSCYGTVPRCSRPEIASFRL
ncbi:hypothetical protein BC827DRAFT_1169742 [Russula dissimulans]|nr:hypothetical protein BC827DRAFT_1169742 [Russula dissimulans]